MYFEGALFGERSAPAIVNDHGRADLRRLRNSFGLSAISSVLPGTLNEVEINGAFVVIVAAPHGNAKLFSKRRN